MPQDIEPVPRTPDSPHIVSPLTPMKEPMNAPLKEQKSIGQLRDDSSIKHPPNYSQIWTEDHGKEVVPIGDGKQVVPSDGIEHEPPADDKHVILPADEKETFLGARGGQGEREEERRRTWCGMRRRLVVICGAMILLLAIGLGVGLAFGLNKKASPAAATVVPAYTGAGKPDQTFLTGIDYDDPFPSEGSDTDPLTDLFYQRKDGLIRQATMLTNGTWLGAAPDDFVATDAKVGTPIAVTSFTLRKNQTSTQARHLFYIDSSGTLRERLFDNITRVWTSGSLDQLGLKPISNASLQVCNGNDFVGNSNGSGYRDGLSLFYGYTESSIQQVGWNYDDTRWVKEQTFVDVNGRGGVACHIRPEMSTVIAQNKTDIVFYWRDSNFTHRGNSTHPIGVWQKADVSIPGIYENAAISMRAYGFGGRGSGGGGGWGGGGSGNNGTGNGTERRSGRNGWTPNRYVLTQSSDLTIHAYNITGSAEKMAIAPITFRNLQVPSVVINSGVKALPGTRLSFTMDPGPAGRNSTRRTWITWFQTQQGSIAQFMAGSDDLDRWGVSSVDIGD